MKKLITLVLCLSAVLALSACGGGSSDEAQIKSAIHEAMQSDSPSTCSSSSTQAFVEQSTHESGQAALRACEESIEDPHGERAESEQISKVVVDGSEASAQIAIQGGSLDQQTLAVSLVKDGGDWKFASIDSLVKVDKPALARLLEGKVEAVGGASAHAEAVCLGKAIEGASKADLEAALFGEDVQAALAKVARACLPGGSAAGGSESESLGASGSEGSGYSFGMPPGFAAATVEGEGGSLPSLQAIATAAAAHKGAGITVAELPNVDAGNEAELHALASRFERENEAVVPKLGAKASKVATTRVGGNLALRWKLTGTGGGPFPGTDAEVIAVFSPTGHNAAEVSCRWGHDAGEKQAIAAGCQSVLNSLAVE